MEELGIGRPSTYAKTMDTLKTRGYTEMVDKKFVPTATGIEITAINDVTPVPHNGCRPPKRRRI